MAVQILNDMPDVAIHRGDRDYELLRELNSPRKAARLSGRAGFLAATIAIHLVAGIALMNMRHGSNRVQAEPQPIEASLYEAPRSDEAPPPLAEPPIASVVYALPTPPELTFESESIAPEVTTAIAAPSQPQSVAPPLVESIEYLHADKPVFPRESQRKREYGTVLVRVLVDTSGRPSQLQIERTSGYERLDEAALRCVEKFRFRPYEVNGVARPAQVLIPVGFDPPHA